MIRQLRSAPNLLTLLRLVFIPFIVIAVVENRYGLALGLFIAAGISDGLDGLLARLLKQKTLLGQYLDPIADKLLLSTMFLVLAATHRGTILVFATVLVFARDIIILIVCTLLYITGTMKVFRPSLFGKANTLAQIVTVPLVLLHEVSSAQWIAVGRKVGIYATIALTVISGVHYLVRVAFHLRHAGGDKQ
ncbi:MAG TPA: CDP-alcohol phosphatidyltransferase family protein [Verrucomicrobiae bacterium]|jgi:cardiolipin synthase|nr:CDP-alcohol phosphatidyltransferase family protein [Verrucomicrobiae bacterium]